MDRTLIYIAALLRSIGIGMTGVLMAIFLKEAGQNEVGIGLIISVGLVGGAIGTLGVTFLTDRIGRKRSLLLLTLAMAGGGALLALSGSFVALAAGALLGMVNGMGHDRGPAYSLEQAVIPSTATDRRRTAAFAWYNMLMTGGLAVGQLMARAPDDLQALWGLDRLRALRFAMLLPAGFVALSLILYLFLSRRIEVREAARRVTPRSKAIIAKLAALSAVDSFGGGFLVRTMIAYWFFVRFDLTVESLGMLFAAGSLLQGLSFHVAARLSRRIGLVNTMVFTHIPASLLLMSVPFAQTFTVAIVLWLVREFLVEMDVPTRQSYIAAVVRPEERPLAAGITNMTRTGAWALGAPLAGTAMKYLEPAAPLFIGGAIKIAYDLTLWRMFRKLKPPEEESP